MCTRAGSAGASSRRPCRPCPPARRRGMISISARYRGSAEKTPLGRPLHALVGLRQGPELPREVGATTELWLIIVRAFIKNIQAHTGTAEPRRQPNPIPVPCDQDVPGLTREVA